LKTQPMTLSDLLKNYRWFHYQYTGSLKTYSIREIIINTTVVLDEKDSRIVTTVLPHDRLAIAKLLVINNNK